jgi:hypothetical protein
MNKNDFEDYYQAKFDDNAILFAESKEGNDTLINFNKNRFKLM